METWETVQTSPRDLPAPSRYLSCTVAPDLDGRTVGEVLHRCLKVTEGQVRHAKGVECGILLDGTRVKTGVRVQAGQRLAIAIGDTAADMARCTVAPFRSELSLVYEDDDLLVADKPAGLLVHPLPGTPDSLGGRVMAHYLDSGCTAAFHPVHRLDKDTSGLVVVAKNAYTQDRLTHALHTQAFERGYLAVCEGAPPLQSGTICAPIGVCQKGGLKARCVAPDGKPAVTHYELVRHLDTRSLLALRLETGRTHQIRVHLAHLGCPIAGDRLYGTPCADIGRTALHSARLALVHPVTREALSFTAPPPADFAALLQ